MMKVCSISVFCFLLLFSALAQAQVLFWDDFEDGTWEDKWINAAQGIYEIIDAAEYNSIYGHFPLDDANNKGVLVFGGDQGLANVNDHSFVAKDGPFSFGTAKGITFESMAQWVAGGQDFVLSLSETDTTGLDRNLAYFDLHVRTILDPALVTMWVQTHSPMDNHFTHVDNIPAPPVGKFSKISFYLDEDYYKLYVNGDLVDEDKHESDMKKGYMSWSTTGGWGLLDNVVIYEGDYSPKAFEIAKSVEPAQKLSSTWGAIKSQN